MTEEEAKNQVCKTLYYALIEMRVQAHETNDKLVFHLADLFHNVPGSISRIGDDWTWQGVLQALEQKASDKGCSSWMENIIISC